MNLPVIIHPLDPANLPSRRMGLVRSPQQMVLAVTSGKLDAALYPLPGTSPGQTLTRSRFSLLYKQFDRQLLAALHKRNIGLRAREKSDKDDFSTNDSPLTDFPMASVTDLHDHVYEHEHTIMLRRLSGTLIMRPEDSDACHANDRRCGIKVDKIRGDNTDDESDDESDGLYRTSHIKVTGGRLPLYIVPANHAVMFNSYLAHGAPGYRMISPGQQRWQRVSLGASEANRTPAKRPLSRHDMWARWNIDSLS